MEIDKRMKIRSDSKSIALLAVFSSIIIALEIFPIPGITDLYTPAPNFTIDWTGIPIVIIFAGLGIAYSFIAVIIMWVTIGYRHFDGAAFKGFAESFTLLGLVFAKLVMRNRELNWKSSTLIYVFFGALFRSIGMLFGNAFLLQLFYTSSSDAAFALSIIYIPWNLIQAIINIVGGLVLYLLIPENLKIEAGLGKYGDDQQKFVEMSPEDIDTG